MDKEKLAELVLAVDKGIYEANTALDALKDFISLSTAEEKPITMLEAREAFSAFVKDYGKDKALEVLRTFNASKFTDIKADDYAVFVERIGKYES